MTGPYRLRVVMTVVRGVMPLQVPRGLRCVKMQVRGIRRLRRVAEGLHRRHYCNGNCQNQDR